jgi:hypothetical protein
MSACSSRKGLPLRRYFAGLLEQEVRHAGRFRVDTMMGMQAIKLALISIIVVRHDSVSTQGKRTSEIEIQVELIEIREGQLG